MPSGRLLSPETSVPNKDLFLDRSQHDQNQTNRYELREYTKPHSQTSAEHRARQAKNSAWCDRLRPGRRDSRAGQTAEHTAANESEKSCTVRSRRKFVDDQFAERQ